MSKRASRDVLGTTDAVYMHGPRPMRVAGKEGWDGMQVGSGLWVAFLTQLSMSQPTRPASSSCLPFLFHRLSGGGRCKEAAAALTARRHSLIAPAGCSPRALHGTCDGAAWVWELVKSRHVTPGLGADAGMRRLRPTLRISRHQQTDGKGCKIPAGTGG